MLFHLLLLLPGVISKVGHEMPGLEEQSGKFIVCVWA